MKTCFQLCEDGWKEKMVDVDEGDG